MLMVAPTSDTFFHIGSVSKMYLSNTFQVINKFQSPTSRVDVILVGRLKCQVIDVYCNVQLKKLHDQFSSEMANGSLWGNS